MTKRVYTTRAWRAAKHASDNVGPLSSVVLVAIENSDDGVGASIAVKHGDAVTPAIERRAEEVRLALVETLARLEVGS